MGQSQATPERRPYNEPNSQVPASKIVSNQIINPKLEYELAYRQSKLAWMLPRSKFKKNYFSWKSELLLFSDFVKWKNYLSSRKLFGPWFKLYRTIQLKNLIFDRKFSINTFLYWPYVCIVHNNPFLKRATIQASILDARNESSPSRHMGERVVVFCSLESIKDGVWVKFKTLTYLPCGILDIRRLLFRPLLFLI